MCVGGGALEIGRETSRVKFILNRVLSLTGFCFFFNLNYLLSFKTFFRKSNRFFETYFY